MASDVIDDGMGLELTDLGSSKSGPVLEAFWHDDGTGFDFIVHGACTVRFEVVERFVTAARRNLPPTNESDGKYARPLIGRSARGQRHERKSAV